MAPKTIIILEQPIRQNNSDIYTAYFGKDIIFWDVSVLLYGKNVCNKNDINIPNKKIYLNKESLIEDLNKITTEQVIVAVSWLWQNKFLFQMLHKTNINYACAIIVEMALPSRNTSRLKGILKGISLENILNFVMYNFPEFFHIRCPGKIYYNTSSTLRYYSGLIRSNTLKIKIKPITYIKYEKSLLNPSPIQKPYGIFIDEYLPRHFDNIFSNTSINDNKYYKSMNKLFNTIEQTTGTPIIIAEHPQSNYTFEFGKRVRIKNNTADLVRHADFVIAHSSTAISYAVLNYKPLLLITTNEISTQSNQHLIKILSDKLNIPILNIDKFEFTTLPMPNIKKYNEYITNHIYKQE